MRKLEVYSTRVYRLLFIANVWTADEHTARDKARSEMMRRECVLTHDTFRIEVREVSPGLFECHVFDFYFVEQLSFEERLRHLMYKVRATALFYIGVVPELVVIK